MSMRGQQILTWIGHTALVGFSHFPPSALLFQTLVDLPRGRLSFVDVLPPIVLALVLLAFSGWFCLLLVRLPRYWTEQGVTADHLGITVTEAPLWWLRGNRVFVPWEDVHHITRTRRGTRRSFRLTAEVRLSRVGREAGLPLWAALIPRGKLKWGVSPSRPALLFDARSRTAASELEAVLRAVRPDLFKDDRPWDDDSQYILL
jgi:hypothetical protein